MTGRELSIRDARAQFAEVVTAAESGEVAYLTRHGVRVAAVVPLELAEAAPSVDAPTRAAWDRLLRARAAHAAAEAAYWQAMVDATESAEDSPADEDDVRPHRSVGRATVVCVDDEDAPDPFSPLEELFVTLHPDDPSDLNAIGKPSG